MTMVATDTFSAESAMGWAKHAESYPWDVVREYLEALLAQGILERISHPL